MKLRNTNPIGTVDIPSMRLFDIQPGAEFEVSDEDGQLLLCQVGNYELASTPSTPADTTVTDSTEQTTPADQPQNESE